MTPRDYTKTLADRKTLTTAMSALSLIEFPAKRGIPEDTFVQATSDEKSECAATALGQKSGPKPEDNYIKILWAKNDSAPITVTQQNYLNNLIASFRRLDTPDQTLRLVIDACRPKIVQRCKKLVNEFNQQADESPDNVFRVSQTSEVYRPLQERLRELGMLKPDQTLQQGLNLFMKFLKAIAANKAKPDKVHWALVFAYRITEGAQSIRKVTTPYQCHRIRKLADYRQVCYTMREICSKIPTKLRETFSEQQIRPPVSESFKIPRLTLDALNTWVDLYPGNEAVRHFEHIESYFPFAEPGPGGPGKPGGVNLREVNTSAHCELTLALHMLKSTKSKAPRRTIELGCSKASCHWCHHYLVFLNQYSEKQQWPHIVSRATRGKKTEGWSLPAGPAQVTRDFLQLAGTEMQELFNTIPEQHRRESDSRSIGRVMSHEDSDNYDGKQPDDSSDDDVLMKD